MKPDLSGTGLRPAHLVAIAREKTPGMTIAGRNDPDPTDSYLLDKVMPRCDTAAQMADRVQPDLFLGGSSDPLHLDRIRTGLARGERVLIERQGAVSPDENFALAEGDCARGCLRIMRRGGTIRADHDCTRGVFAGPGNHHGADRLTMRASAAFPGRQSAPLAAGAVCAMAAVIVPVAADQARIAGRRRMLPGFWTQLDRDGSRA